MHPEPVGIPAAQTDIKVPEIAMRGRVGRALRRTDGRLVRPAQPVRAQLHVRCQRAVLPNVCLGRRASGLRTYAGDTSLPGGKWDPEDRNMESTARREAFEEVCRVFCDAYMRVNNINYASTSTDRSPA